MIKDKKFIPILILICSSIFLFNVVTKAFWVIIQIVILKKYNDTTPLAHLNAVAILLSIAVTFLIPTFMAKVQTRYLLMIMPISAMLLVVAFPYLDTTFWGYVLTIGVLLVGGINQIIGVILINQTLADKFRTTFQGIYNTFYNLSIGIGPLLVATFGAENKFTLYGFLAIGLLAVSVAFFFDRVEWSFQDPPAPKKPTKFQKWMAGIDVIRSNSILLLLVVITCLNMNMVSHLLVFWGDSYALDLQTSKSLPAVFALGGAFLSIPIGYMADKLGLIRVFLMTTVTIMICFTILSLDTLFEAIDYMALFLVGGSVAVMITITLSYIGRMFSGAALAKATAGFAFFRLVFGIVGLYIAGEIIDHLEAYGLNRILSIINLVLLIGLFSIFQQKKKQGAKLT